MIKKVEFSEGMLTESNFEGDKWNILRDLYKKNYLEAAPSSNLKIPKIIHQIWLGSNLPENLKTLQQTWKKFHPDWEYKLWTDGDVKNLKIQNREIFDKTKNLGAKSDILRYEILYQFGGLYVDTDFECLKSFNDLHYLCDFYGGVFESGAICINNALIGVKEKSEIIKKVLDGIMMPEKKIGENFGNKILNTTGPMYFSRKILESLMNSNEKCLILPSIYFYPSPNSNTGKSVEYQKSFIKNESYAIHYWFVSWGKQNYWKKFLKKIFNFFYD